MLTRDITLQDCILDLIDNSINWIISSSDIDVSAIFNSQNHETRFSDYFVNVNFNHNTFSIQDNWSGIPPENLENYVFRFWSDETEVNTREIKWLSVYWVGMKRSFFKIGRHAKLTTFSGTNKSFLDWDINQWLEKDESENDAWNLEFALTQNDDEEKWTLIEITQINNEIAEMFKEEGFGTSLRNKIALSYWLFIECGLKINVNNLLISTNLPQIISDDEIGYSLYEESFSENGKEGEFKIIAWLTSASTADFYWWNIFCNWRMILQWDKSMKTWWGWWLRQFHSSLNPFLGYVFFTSKNADFLPWNTTKDNVNFESNFYQQALKNAIRIASPIVKDLASRYRKNDTIWEYEERGKNYQNLPSINISQLLPIKKSDNIFKPSTNKRKQKQITDRITYLMDTEKIESVKNVLVRNYWAEDDIDNSSIGERTFEYFYKREC